MADALLNCMDLVDMVSHLRATHILHIDKECHNLHIGHRYVYIALFLNLKRRSKSLTQ